MWPVHHISSCFVWHYRVMWCIADPTRDPYKQAFIRYGYLCLLILCWVKRGITYLCTQARPNQFGSDELFKKDRVFGWRFEKMYTMSPYTHLDNEAWPCIKLKYDIAYADVDWRTMKMTTMMMTMTMSAFTCSERAKKYSHSHHCRIFFKSLVCRPMIPKLNWRISWSSF